MTSPAQPDTPFDVAVTLERDDVQNGILLRTDLHSLFDMDLLAIDSTTMTVLVSPTLAGSEYATFSGSAIRVPEAAGDRPSVDALEWHRLNTGLSCDEPE